MSGGSKAVSTERDDGIFAVDKILKKNLEMVQRKETCQWGLEKYKKDQVKCNQTENMGKSWWLWACSLSQDSLKERVATFRSKKDVLKTFWICTKYYWKYMFYVETFFASRIASILNYFCVFYWTKNTSKSLAKIVKNGPSSWLLFSDFFNTNPTRFL